MGSDKALLEALESSAMDSSFLSRGSVLAKTRWKEYCEDTEMPLGSESKKAALAVMLENTYQFMANLDETVKAVSIGDFQKYAFPLVRAIFPELIANDLVSVQPMLSPTSLVFYMDFVYGSNKGSIMRGDTAYSSVNRGNVNPYYSSSMIDLESTGLTGNGTDYGQSGTAFTASLSWLPVTPGSLTITDGTQVMQDDGNGNLIGQGTAGTINYATGAIAGGKFNATPSSGQAIVVSYRYDNEANSNIAEMELVIQQVPVQAYARKMKTSWSLEAGFNLRTLHGLELESELVAAIGAKIREEIDREIIADLQRMAGAGSVFWNSDLPSGVGYTEAKLTILDTFAKGSDLVNRATGRAQADYVVAGPDVATVVETLPGFVPTPGVPSGLIKGPFKMGRLNNRYDVYRDPFYPAKYFLMGHKGESFLDAGYVYAPYIPLCATPTVVLEDFKGRKGLMTSYGKKAINPNFYVTGQIGSGASLGAKAGVASTLLTNNSGNAVLTSGTALDIGKSSGRAVFGV